MNRVLLGNETFVFESATAPVEVSVFAAQPGLSVKIRPVLSQPQARSLLLISMLLALLTGCKNHLEPASYSPDYQALTRADGRVEVIPVECLKPPAQEQFDTDEEKNAPLLPPGCANNFTLLQMVEQRSDLFQGRNTGPTMAAPVGRAAQVYIDGYDREELRRRQSEQRNQTNSQEGR